MYLEVLYGETSLYYFHIFYCHVSFSFALENLALGVLLFKGKSPGEWGLHSR